jgi:hypothetical protein
VHWVPEVARRLIAAVAVCAVASACSSPGPSGSPADALAEVPEPGRPYAADAILQGMRASNRPGGVPDQLETDGIATTLAQRIWTVDGEPWATISIGGSCGPVRCTLDVAGSRSDSLGDDVYAFEIIPASGEIAMLSAELRSIGPEVAAVLDRLARAAEPAIERDGLALASARWRPPPNQETFDLSYRSGDEEGSCELELWLDAASGAVEVTTANGC